MKLGILVISSYFPPVPGVGGRRCAKFVKYLSRNEALNVHVVSAKNTVKQVKSSFQTDLLSANFKHTVLPSNYPYYLELLEFAKANLWRKIMFRLQLFLIKKKVEGNYWDFSVFWDEHFKETIPTIITQDNISKIVVSGPPYRYIKYTIELKTRFPEIEIILDYRDPWNNFNEPPPISPERSNYERELEKEMLKSVDKIITISQFQKRLIQQIQPQSAPIYVIPNGFDPEDFEFRAKMPLTREKVKFVHFGTLHVLKDYYWKPFYLALLRLKKEHPEVYHNTEIQHVGYTPPQIESFIRMHNLDVKIHGILDPFDAYNILNDSDVALWFKYDKSEGDFATKFSDYIAVEKFMWTFSVKGEVTEYVEKHQIGKVFYRDDQKLEESIYRAFLEAQIQENRLFNPNFDNSAHNLKDLSNQFLMALKE
jgi:glycosyltransferase involved in cell wall biosynthesis